MAKLVLLEREVSLIRGLMLHAKLNDQQITAIFSHLDRNINHREIGAIRKPTPKYAKIIPASVDEVRSLLAQYRRVQAMARRVGVNPSSEDDLRVEKAVELMKSAVTVYNNSTIGFRTEIFIINAIIAWTYVLHAYYLKSKVDPVYKKDGVQVLTPEGAPKYWDLAACLAQPKAPLSKGEVNNLRYLLLLRHEIEHRVARDVGETVQPKVQACAINFSDFCERHFGEGYSLKYELDFAIQFVKLTVGASNLQKAASSVPAAVQAVNMVMEENMTPADYNDPAYAYRVYVVPKTVNNPKVADQAVTFAPAGSEIEMAIKFVERPKLRAREVLESIRKLGYKRFGMQRFIEFWKAEGLKDPKKNLAVQLGGQWFWYPEVIDIIRKHLDAQVALAKPVEAPPVAAAE